MNKTLGFAAAPMRFCARPKQRIERTRNSARFKAISQSDGELTADQGLNYERGSNAQEYFAPIHPIKDKPTNQNRRGTVKDRLVSIAKKSENAVAEIREEIFLDETVEQMIDAVSRN